MPEIDPVVAANREILTEAQAQGTAATLGAFTKLSGPGWLQSAVTLGGGSLAGALFLGILGGTNLLWLQLMAITMGVVMLSAISYVTLSTGERPFRAINTHINPVLGWGWLIATCMANIIWAMPQFALCYAALQKNLIGPPLDESAPSKLIVSVILLSLAFTVVLMNGRQGAAAKAFDMFLKLLIAMVVICFVGVVIYLGLQGQLNWGKILSGFIPNLNQWSQPTGEVAQLLSTLPQSVQDFWSGRVVSEQRSVMIGAAATAVGINMTFLMPYSMLSRGWDKPFRGLARFDLCTGMAIPYVLVTSCVVIAAATMFHAAADEAFLSSDVETMKTSSLFEKARPAFAARVADEMGAEAFDALDENAQNLRIAQLDQNEKRVASSLVKRNAFQLSQALSPLLGERTANLIFGIGILGMGFSTIIILMLINGYAFCELLGKEQGGVPHFLGCLVAGVSGALWFEFWDGEAKLWLAILASSFGMMLLPIAYFTFFMMMNSKSLLGDEKPTGFSMLVWNVLMLLSVAGAVVAAAFAIYDKANHPVAGRTVIAVAAIYLVLVVLGFIFRRKPAKLASS